MDNSKFRRLFSMVTITLSTVLELGASLALSTLVGPFILVLWLINTIVRLLITAIFKFQARSDLNPKLSLVSDGTDALWGFRKPGNSRNIIILYIYNSRMSLDVFRQNYSDKVINYTDSNGVKPYQKLSNIFRRKFGYYCWEECKNFAIEDHIRSFGDDKDRDGIMTESEVLKFMSSLAQDMSEERPQWEEILVPRFAYDQDMANGTAGIPERSARIYRSHHAYMDGCSTLLMSGTCMGDPSQPFPYVLNPLSPSAVAQWKQILFKLSCVIFGLSTLAKSIFQASRIQSPFLMNQYSGKQKFTWAPSIDLSMIRTIKDKTNVSIPAILSSATIGALKSLKQQFPTIADAEIADASESSISDLSFGLVGAILPYPDIHPKNRFTVVNFTARGRAEDNRLSRLASTQKEMRKLTQSPQGLVAYFVFQVFGKFPACMIQLWLSAAKTPIIHNNVPWTSQKVKLWGHEVNDIAGWMPLLTFAGIGLLCVTYADKVRLCIIYDESCLSDTQIQFLIDQLQKEIQLLVEDSAILPLFKENGKLPIV